MKTAQPHMDDPSIFTEPAGGGVCLQTIAGHRHRVSALQLVNSEVWSGSSDGTILIHDAAVRTAARACRFSTQSHRTPCATRQSGEYLLTLQIPGKGGDDDVVSAILCVRGYVWAASSDGSINIFNATVRRLVCLAIFCFFFSNGFGADGQTDHAAVGPHGSSHGAGRFVAVRLERVGRPERARLGS